MWGRELGVSSYRWPLPLVLCCFHEGKRDQKGPEGTRRERGNAVVLWSEREEKENTERRENSNRSHFSGNRRPDKPSTILSSSAATGYLATSSCCLQVAPSWQQGWVGAAAAADRQRLRPFTVPPWAALCWNMTHIPWLTQAASQTGGGCVPVDKRAQHASEVIKWIWGLWIVCRVWFW